MNAPYVFSGVWTVIKGFIDEKTRAKIKLVSNGHTKLLLDLIDEDQLAVSMGGKNEAKLEDDVGLWNDYEVVDGHEPGDVVGVRKISDGPDSKIYTPADVEALPNYMIDAAPVVEGEEEKTDN